jgi:hypothetical protein
MSSPYGPPGGSDGFDRAISGAHADYHREIQQHTSPDELVDDVVTYRMLAPHLMRTLLFLVVPTVLLLIKIVIDYLASMSSPDSFTNALSTLLGVLIVVLYLAGVAAFFAPAKEPIAEHARLLENRGDAAGSAYEHVQQAAAARRSPAEVHPGSVAGVPVLLFRQHSERAMLLVQPYGNDLYVGWTMWRSRSTATLLVHFLRDTFGRFGSSPRFSAELRAASTRALRESVHSLSREGVTAALHTTGSAAQDPDTGGWVRGPAVAHHAHPSHPSHPAPPGPEPSQPGRPEPRRPEPDRGVPAWIDEPHTSGALRTAGRGPDHHTAWTGAGRGEGDRVSARREADEDWGPPPRDRW